MVYLFLSTIPKNLKHFYPAVKCPAGYKTVDGACKACEIGTYNAAKGAIECLACEGSKTTFGTGSTKADQCYDLCTVPEVRYFLVVPF